MILLYPDTQVERNALVERVYPKLKEFCREQGYEFQVIDMRWGVKDPDWDDHMFPELCIRELTKCQKISTGPKFVVGHSALMLFFDSFTAFYLVRTQG